MTTEEHAVLTTIFMQKAKGLGYPIGDIPEDMLESFVGTLIADVSLVCDGTVPFDEWVAGARKEGWSTDPSSFARPAD